MLAARRPRTSSATLAHKMPVTAQHLQWPKKRLDCLGASRISLKNDDHSNLHRVLVVRHRHSIYHVTLKKNGFIFNKHNGSFRLIAVSSEHSIVVLPTRNTSGRKTESKHRLRRSVGSCAGPIIPKDLSDQKPPPMPSFVRAYALVAFAPGGFKFALSDEEAAAVISPRRWGSANLNNLANRSGMQLVCATALKVRPPSTSTINRMNTFEYISCSLC